MLLNVQALRGLAAFLVIFVHLERLAELAGLPRGITVFGNSGVDVFFVISGLIMVATTYGRRETAAGFLRKRVSRIVPLYWVVTLAVFAIALTAPRLMQSTTASVPGLVKSLAFIPYARPDGSMHPVVFLGWTLNYEMMFYLLFALGMLAPNRLLGVGATLGALVLAAGVGRAFPQRDPLLAFYTAPVILEFGGGMVLGVLLVKERLPSSRRLGWLAILAAAVALLAMVLGPWIWRPDVDRSLMFGIPAVVIVAAALIAERAGLTCSAGWIQLLGAASYSIYLTHFFCTQAIVLVAERFARLGPAFLFLLVPLAFILIAVVGVVVHKTVELPLTNFARRLLVSSRRGSARPFPAKLGKAQAEPSG